MIKTIEQLLNGRYEYSVTPPILSVDRIDLRTAPGADARGYFVVKSADGQRLRGVGHVDNARIVLAHDRFTGTEFRVVYGVDVKGLKEGDSVDGSIILTLNAGEIVVPVHLLCEEEGLKNREALGSLEDFVQLARYDMRGAYRLFADGKLDPVLSGEDASLRTLYRAMTVNPVTYQRMEEFLVSAGKKDAVQYTADRNSAIFESLTESAQGILRITKNTWGNVSLSVSADGSFISLPQKHFVEDDFVGNTLDLVYIIQYEELGEGLQTGTIEIASDTNTLYLQVTASRHIKETDPDRLARKKAIAGISHDLIDHRLGKTNSTAFVKRCIPRIAALRRMTEDTLPLDLLEALIYEHIGAVKAASDIMRKWRDHDFGEETASFEAAHLYLSSKTRPGSVSDEELVEELRSLFQEDEDSLMILFLLLRTDRDLKNHPGRVLSYMSRMYRSGLRSPFLLIEAAMILSENAHLLGSLSPFTKNILLTGLRNKSMSQDLALRAALLSENEKVFTPAMYRILSGAYRMYPLDDILEALCRLILKGNPRREEFHVYYAKAVERDIRITRLYEYFMETLPENYRKPLPVKVRRYFTMNNTLGAGRKALLFANIILNRSYDRETYNEYTDMMAEFARDMLRRGSMNEDFAVVYSEFIPTVPTREMADAMAAIMFRHLIVCDDPRAREVIVVHEALKREEAYPVYHGRAYADIYSDDALILFKDERGKRFRSGVRYSTTRLIDYNTYIDACRRFRVRDAGFIAHLCAVSGRIGENEEGLAERMYAASSDDFTDAFRTKTNDLLLEYFAAHPESDSIDLYLSRLTPDGARDANHALLIEVMVMRGMYREAFTLACSYGYEDLEPHLLMTLAGKIIVLKDYAEDEELTLAAADAFRRGAYDRITVRYLNAHFEGTIEDMERVCRAAEKIPVDTREIDERILRYSMFSRKNVEDGASILKRYAEGGGNRRICEAYLNYEALRSFMESTPLQAPIAEALSGAFDDGRQMSTVCRLSLLRYYAMQEELTGEEEKRRDRLFAEAVRSGMLFSFMSRLPLSLRQKYQLDDKMIIECRALPTDKVLLRYRTQEGGEAEAPMRRMTGGIFAKAFVMFAGEVFRYKSVIVRGDEMIEGPEEVMIMPMSDGTGRSRYQRINRMIAEKKEGRTDAFRESVRKYRLAVHTVEELFPLKDTREVRAQGGIGNVPDRKGGPR